MITIIDYNSGNIASIQNAISKLGFECIVSSDKEVIKNASKVIFPGQGSASQAMKELKKRDLIDTIKNLTCPFLGICLGMQILFDFSEEENTKCLGIISGNVKKFEKEKNIKIPQMGYNSILIKKKDQIFREIISSSDMYFANSFYVESDDDFTLSETFYGNKISSIIRKDNFYGVQFHPEKSGQMGLKLLDNFCKIGSFKETEIIPAIDILDGECVRLLKGDFNKKTYYDNDPVEVSKEFEFQGAKFLHIVDLSGAKDGKPKSEQIISEIIRETNLKIQVGGGIRTYKYAKKYFDMGVARIVLGTSVLDNPNLVRNLIKDYGEKRVLIAVDIKNNKIAINGWENIANISLMKFLKELKLLGVQKIVFTDTEKDGTMNGPNYSVVEKIISQGFSVICAGGISTLSAINRLKKSSVDGLIIGKALYENKLDLKDCLYGKTKTIKFKKDTIKKRIIACMDIQNGKVIKGIKYKKLQNVGDPVKLSKKYSKEGIDELVFLDITASIEKRKLLFKLVQKISKNINIPFTIGGGIKTISDIDELLKAGADKVSIGSEAVINPEFIKESSTKFGSQCIVVSIDPFKVENKWKISMKGGREKTNIDAISFARKMEEFGAGELLVNSIDKDGGKNGFDIELLKLISDEVNIPVIASSGAGKKEDFLEVFKKTNVDAALAASLFHYQEIDLEELKQYLKNNNINIR